MNYRVESGEIKNVELSTGLKDINGTEIFENDLVLWWYVDSISGIEPKKPMGVKFYRGEFCLIPYGQHEMDSPVFYQGMFLNNDSDNYFLEKVGRLPDNLSLFKELSEKYRLEYKCFSRKRDELYKKDYEERESIRQSYGWNITTSERWIIFSILGSIFVAIVLILIFSLYR